MSRLCIIPCGTAKIWDKIPNAGPTEAQYVYTGVFASACQMYAIANFDHWVILSAKYGFLLPSDIVDEDYNVSFNKQSNETVNIDTLKEQAIKKGLNQFHEITVLGGKNYTSRVKEVFNQGQTLLFPLEHCKGIGYMLQWLTQANNNGGRPDPLLQVQNKAETSINKETPNVGKYLPLYHFLRDLTESEIRLSMMEVESILKFSLPASAYKHNAWWANDLTHSQAKAWLYAGREAKSVVIGNEVTFSRVDRD